MIQKARRRTVHHSSHPERSASGAESKDPVAQPCDVTPELPPSATGEYWVYILTNDRRTVLYIGITNSLATRIAQHLLGKADSFTRQYNATDLVYYESFSEPLVAIAREKQLKGWTRKKKETLIAKINPSLMDLVPRLFGEEWKSEACKGRRTEERRGPSTPAATPPPLRMTPMEAAIS